VYWSERCLTPAGCRGKVETPQARSVEEARLPPRGKQAPVAERNGHCILPNTTLYTKRAKQKERMLSKRSDTMDGKKIKLLRKQKGISLSQLSEITGISKSYLSLMERDIQTNPSLDIIEKIAEAFDVAVAEIVRRDRADIDFSKGPSQVKSTLKVEIELSDDQLNPQKLRQIQELLHVINSNT
jgi:XRE family transcriptional regulator, master regulator for biofilm formation